MEKTYIRVEDQDVAVYHVYAHTDGKAYADAAHTKQLTTSELKKAFMIGCVIITATAQYKPVSYKEAAGVATVTYATADTTPTTAKLATVVSVADPA